MDDPSSDPIDGKQAASLDPHFTELERSQIMTKAEKQMEAVEQLRAKTKITYGKAKEVLEKANWDVLEALILLEKEGIISEQNGAESNSSESDSDGASKDAQKDDSTLKESGSSKNSDSDKQRSEKAGSKATDSRVEERLDAFKAMMKQFWESCVTLFKKGNEIQFQVNGRSGKSIFTVSATLIVILLLLLLLIHPAVLLSILILVVVFYAGGFRATLQKK